MVDPFLSPPLRRGHHGAGRSEARILRDRMAAYEDAVDRASAAADYGSARLLVQVYNGGSMPAAVPRVYYTHPVLATGTVSEGAAASLTADTETTVPVVVLNKVPSVGDYLVAYSAGGRWVSEESGSTSCYSETFGTSTGPCALPSTNLTLSWVKGAHSGTATMAFGYFEGAASEDYECTWSTPCTATGTTPAGFYFGVYVSSFHNATWYFDTFSSGSACTNGTLITQYGWDTSGDTFPNALTLSSYDCASKTIVFTAPGGWTLTVTW
jgi:hypothetical protein